MTHIIYVKSHGHFLHMRHTAQLYNHPCSLGTGNTLWLIPFLLSAPSNNIRISAYLAQYKQYLLTIHSDTLPGPFGKIFTYKKQ